jgi:hypothetical protein
MTATLLVVLYFRHYREILLWAIGSRSQLKYVGPISARD